MCTRGGVQREGYTGVSVRVAVVRVAVYPVCVSLVSVCVSLSQCGKGLSQCGKGLSQCGKDLVSAVKELLLVRAVKELLLFYVLRVLCFTRVLCLLCVFTCFYGFTVRKRLLSITAGTGNRCGNVTGVIPCYRTPCTPLLPHTSFTLLTPLSEKVR